ncbi:hypothetical protein RJ639_028056 [Escallonia herrerae]|uniref:Integrase catalytic domain-containing protein n=1 Tax=Escallonia herrerae TaxID=1293975 RepID=A0AA88X537_9ASTE|nr:hypothetical protein RJ639_028056 [Escallonia herrerae]
MDKMMRSDRGGAFTSNEFKAFCNENDIPRPLTILYSLQQSEEVERKDQSIVNMTGSMLKSNNVKMFDDSKKEMAKEFELTDIGLTSYYLGIKVLHLASPLKVGIHSTLNSTRKKINQAQAMLDLLCRDCLRAHINCVGPRPYLPLTVA